MHSLSFVNTGLSVWTSVELTSLSPPNLEAFSEQLDCLGKLSGVSQNLNGPITSVDKILAASNKEGDLSSLPTNTNQTLIVYCLPADEDPTKVVIVGYIKYCYRHLYFYTSKGKVIEKDPCCILDFYILESKQRMGIGFMLLEQVLQVEKQRVSAFDQCVYDRPSPKLLGFLKKNYKAIKENLQPNKFMIFDRFIDNLG